MQLFPHNSTPRPTNSPVDSPTLSMDGDTIQLATVMLKPHATSPARLTEYVKIGFPA
jgi:hypothetical protein